MGKTDSTANQLAREVRRRKLLQRDLSEARRSLALRTAELDASQARLAESEQNLRTIRDSPTYRVAQRLWRLRRGTRDWLRFRGNSSSADKQASVHSAGLSGPGVGDAVSGQGTDKQPASPAQTVAAVWLLGGLTSAQLIRMLRALSKSGTPASKLLVITDCDAFQALDGFGCKYEFVPSRQDWELRLGREASEYPEFVRRRLTAIGDAHGLSDLLAGQPLMLN